MRFDRTRLWRGSYRLEPFPVVDGAVRFTAGMYEPGTLHCLSFHRRKHLPIGKGGMILTDDAEAARWLRLVRYNGRRMDMPYSKQCELNEFEVVGWNMYMTPEAAATGVQLLAALPRENDDLDDYEGYSDLSDIAAYKTVPGVTRRDV